MEGWSEEDVKNKLIVPLLEREGVGLNEMTFETAFRITIGRNTVKIDSAADIKRGFADILCRRNGEPFLVVEVKAPEVVLGERDRDQAISYARLTEQIAPFAAVTNGREIRLYDVYTREPIEALSGMPVSLPADLERLRDEGARLFCNSSLENLLRVCAAQQDLHLEEHVGAPETGREYNPELYEPRAKAAARFDAFLRSGAQCFALVGASGAGKTAFLCWLVSRERSRGAAARPVFYYDARLLTGSLEETLVADFAWLAGRRATAAGVVTNLTDLARRHGTEFLLVLDGVDEHADTMRFARELNELAHRCRELPVRLCIAAKTTEWRRFLFEGGVRRPLADNVFDSLPQQVAADVRVPTADNAGVAPGTWLPPLDESDEYRGAWSRYAQAFGIGEAPAGELADLCRSPAAMRITAEAFRGAERLPSSVSHGSLLQRWYDRRFDRAPDGSPVRRAVGALAEAMVLSNRGVMGEADAHQVLLERGISEPEGALAEALRWGLNRPTRIDSPSRGRAEPAVVFPHDRLLHYAYLTLSQSWRQMSEGDRVRTLAEAPQGSHLEQAGALALSWLDSGARPLAAALVAEAPATYARLVGDGRAPDGTDPLSVERYFRRLLDAYRSLADGVFGPALRYAEPRRSAAVGLIARVYPALGPGADWGFCPARPGVSEPEVVQAGPDEYPEWGGLDKGWPWWYPRGVRTVHHENLSPPQQLPEHSALRLVLDELKPHCRAEFYRDPPGIGLDEADCPALATVRVRRAFWGAFSMLGADVRERLKEMRRRDELDADEWLREVAVHRHRMALLAQEGNPPKGEPLEQRRARWQRVVAEAERRTGAGEPPPTQGIGMNNDLRQFEAGLRALRAAGLTTVATAPLPAPDTSDAFTDADGKRTLSVRACAAYIEAFFDVAMREYRSLVRRNMPMLERAIPRLGGRGAIVLAEAFPKAVGGPRNVLWIGGQSYRAPAAAIRIHWFASGTDQTQVSVSAVEAPTHPFGEQPKTPWIPCEAEYRGTGETLVERLLFPNDLLEWVYGWLNEDFRVMFGEGLWRGT